MQVPAPQLCHAAHHLTQIFLQGCADHNSPADAEATLAALTALPALQVLTLELNDVAWASPSDADTFMAALSAAKPGLQVFTKSLGLDPVYENPHWSGMSAHYEFTDVD